MYLNVLLLSDITLPSGTQIDMAAYNGDHHRMHSQEQGHKVNQTRPNHKAWAEWKRCLHLFSHQDFHHTLREPLGAWIVRPNNYTPQWHLLYSPTTNSIYCHTAMEYSIHRCLQHDFDCDSELFSSKLPPDAIPIDIKETQHTWILPRRIPQQEILQDFQESFEHIKGHQDKESPYEELPLLAQLNCNAVYYASTFLRINPSEASTSVHQFPAGECVLQLTAGTITQDIKQEMTEAQTLLALKAHIPRVENWWHESVFNTVDWHAHGSALHRHGKHRTTLIKFIHRILPLGKHVHRYDPKYPKHCPSCNADVEDKQHFWRCSAPTKQTDMETAVPHWLKNKANCTRHRNASTRTANGEAPSSP